MIYSFRHQRIRTSSNSYPPAMHLLWKMKHFWQIPSCRHNSNITTTVALSDNWICTASKKSETWTTRTNSDTNISINIASILSKINHEKEFTPENTKKKSAQRFHSLQPSRSNLGYGDRKKLWKFKTWSQRN